MNLYREKIIDHYKNPRNKGLLKNPDITVSESNSTCGDSISLMLKLKIKNSKLKIVEAVGFEGDGCAISQAATSMLTEKLMGKKLSDIEKLKDKDILNLLKIDISPGRIDCAMLPLRALRKISSIKTRSD